MHIYGIAPLAGGGGHTNNKWTWYACPAVATLVLAISIHLDAPPPLQAELHLTNDLQAHLVDHI